MIAEKSVVMKQSRGFYASVSSVVSMYVDTWLCLGCGATAYVKKKLERVFQVRDLHVQRHYYFTSISHGYNVP